MSDNTNSKQTTYVSKEQRAANKAKRIAAKHNAAQQRIADAMAVKAQREADKLNTRIASLQAEIDALRAVQQQLLSSVPNLDTPEAA